MATLSEKDLETLVSQMTPDQQEHLRALISEVVQCYNDDDKHAVLLIDHKTKATIITVNANEMEVGGILAAADDLFSYRALRDAPASEMFN
jgi:hypothetical protein